MAKPKESVPFSKRRAWIVEPEFVVTHERYAAVRPYVKESKHYRPEGRVAGRHAAICFAREQTAKKLGLPPRGKRFDVTSGGFGVRSAMVNGQAVVFVVEGPPDARGELPLWCHVSEGRKEVPVDGEPGLIELVPDA